MLTLLSTKHTSNHHQQLFDSTQADLSFLALLTAPTTTSTPQNKSSSGSHRRPQLDPLILETAALSGPHQTRNHYLHEFFPHPNLAPSKIIKESITPRYLSHQAPRSSKLEKKQNIESLEPIRLALQSRLSNIPKPILMKPKPIKVKCKARARIPNQVGELYLHIYENDFDQKEHLAIVIGKKDQYISNSLNDPFPNETKLDRIIRGASIQTHIPKSFNEIPLVRIHSECLTGEILCSNRCDCGPQLRLSINKIYESQQGGIIIYLRQEGRDIGLYNKLKAYNLQDLGFDTLESNLLLGFKDDERSYEIAKSILLDFGLNQIKLMTNNPTKIQGIENDGQIKVIERVDAFNQNQLNHHESHHGKVDELEKYLRTKVLKMGHLIDLEKLK
ncbi:hypothetical protein CROQUDRAFT_723561 [Cronartium quercuum f. sp. fusiforme G11]|uniref:GTP cyclohydrolase II n=1 Tax=Cronartium quercuum f. sp. fusiforme G11 TaxID=708437 RepID=A0A9P6NEE2_9BASI|nr:hypothetical protein CROQUDRAFT_723561 [Cronartium quercuum f. sp. fusiforme G11]